MNFNKQPKAKIEKVPQENEEFLDTQEQEFGKRENITLEIDGQTIEAVKYYFEYPQHIQKETGILGYERTKISQEKIKEFFSNNSFADKGDKWMTERARYRKIVQVVLNLSNREYPAQTYNHIIGGFANPLERKIMNNDFKSDNFFLQKIYDISRIEKKRSKGYHPNRIFNNPAQSEDNYTKANSNFKLYNKKSDTAVTDDDFIGNISKYKEKIENDEVFMATPNGGLNVEIGKFWQDVLNENHIGVGFPAFGEQYFDEYIEKSLEKLIKIEKNVDDEYLLDISRPISTIFYNYLLSKYKKGDSSSRTTAGWDRNDFISKITTIAQDFFSKHNLGIKTGGEYSFGNRKYTLSEILEDNFLHHYFHQEEEYFDTGKLAGSYDIYLPIFIGADEVPQLSWGHAKYAHFMNEKGLNFFKFKHADHLPEKIEKEK